MESKPPVLSFQDYIVQSLTADFVLVLIVLVVLALLIVLLLWWLLRRSRTRLAGPGWRPVSFETPPAVTPPPDRRFALRQAFAQMDSRLRELLPGHDYRYRIPWILLLGQAGAGKSTLLADLGAVPAGNGTAPVESPPCRWWFFNQGLVLDLAGNLLRDQETNRLRPTAWREVLRLLQRYRPRRPLDGVLLVIPADALTDSQTSTPEARRDHARQLYQRLRELQNTLGLRLPLYVLISQCDRLPGFTALAGELPTPLASSLLGWSNPDNLDAAYNSAWIDTAFAALNQDVFQLQADVMAAKTQLADADSLLLFPTRFAELREPLRTYLDELFQPSAYHEAFFLRGLYFTGAGPGVTRPTPSPAPGSPSPPQAAAGQRFFLQDLFTDKIFPEQGLARPVGWSLLQRNRRVILVQAAILLLVVGGGLGLWYDYQSLEAAAAGLPQVLKKSNEVRDELLQWEGPQTATPFRKRFSCTEGVGAARSPLPLKPVQELLEELANIHTRSYTSLFIPYAWFSSLRNQVRKALIGSYTESVLPAMCQQLVACAAALLQTDTNLCGLSTADNAVGPQRSEFVRISRLIAGFTELEQNINRYDHLYDWQQLISNPETAEFPALAAYVFSLPLTEAKRKFGKNVDRAKSVEVDMAGRIENTQLQDDFTATFQPLSIANYKRRALEKLFQGRPLPAGIDVEAAWKDLKRFLDEDFQSLDSHSQAGEKPLVLTIPAGKRLVWDAPPLQDAVKLSDSFSNFRNFGLKNNYPALQPLQPYLEQLLSPLVEDLIKSDLARAQRFENKSSLRSIPVNEAELRSDSQNFTDTTELLTQLQKKLGQLRFTGLQTGLAGLVRSAAIDQLQAVNALLSSERLYEPAVGFAAWDGGPGLNLLAFAVPDQGALGAYLISQRERVATLANQYARPSLSYLVQSNQPAGSLMLRWRQLITDLDDYYSNRPDNPIADLENFILGELGAITAAGCSSRIAAAADRNQGDFFVLKRLELQRRVLTRCDKVAAVRVNSAYRTLAAAFNNQLAGRFPFVTTAVANTLSRLPSGDAEPSVIRAVFSLSEQLPDNVKAAMSSGDAGSARLSSSALAFLNALAATRPVLAPWLDAKPGDAVPALGFSIEFRVNRADEIGGDQIIEWTLETGARRIHPTDKDLGGRWQFGEPVRLGLRWATGSPWRPTANRARPDLQVKDDTATFVYPDGWALFKLIDLNRLYPGAGWQEGGGMLMLTVPVQRAASETGNVLRSEARVFIRLLLLGPPNPQGQVQTLVFPVFPAYAPSS